MNAMKENSEGAIKLNQDYQKLKSELKIKEAAVETL